MQELEPQFEVSNIFIIFADKGITDSLPGLIQHSGVPVCGDHYHLLKEVWPRHFGPHLWPSVEPFLQQMFCRGDFSEYEACFKKAMALPGIRGNTIHEEYLRAIHENPRQYAGYKRRSIPGNLGLMGSAPAEQNHSSVTARVGPGGIMSITENMSELLVRQQDIAREDQEKFTKFYSKWKTFQSKYVNDDTSRKMDESAHHALSPYAYTTFFQE
jgi:hypothetical protein